MSGTGTSSTTVAPEDKVAFPLEKIVPHDAKIKDGVLVWLDADIGAYGGEEGAKIEPPIPALWIGLTFEKKIVDESKKKEPAKERTARVTAETLAIPLDGIKGLLGISSASIFAYLLNPNAPGLAKLMAELIEPRIEKVSLRFRVKNRATFQFKDLTKDVTGVAPVAKLVGQSADTEEIFDDLHD